MTILQVWSLIIARGAVPFYGALTATLIVSVHTPFSPPFWKFRDKDDNIVLGMAVKKKVLVIDDEARILRFIRVGLNAAGYETVTTTSGEEGLKLAEAESPDIILLDILMSPMTGFEVLEKLRGFDTQTPVIVFTAKSFIADQATKYGANGFISKPFQPDELIKKIGQTLNHKKP